MKKQPISKSWSDRKQPFVSLQREYQVISQSNHEIDPSYLPHAIKAKASEKVCRKTIYLNAGFLWEIFCIFDLIWCCGGAPASSSTQLTANPNNATQAVSSCGADLGRIVSCRPIQVRVSSRPGDYHILAGLADFHRATRLILCFWPSTASNWRTSPTSDRANWVSLVRDEAAVKSKADNVESMDESDAKGLAGDKTNLATQRKWVQLPPTWLTPITWWDSIIESASSIDTSFTARHSPVPSAGEKITYT